ncbi:MAG: nicotinamide-nucleotide amidohydrolase family protein [Flavisolibacter sp.]
MKEVNACIITIGDELLIGQTIDTNSAFIAQELNKIGIWVKRRIAIGDVKEEILSALKEQSQDCQVIIITGGLGPTADDITKPTLCEYFNAKLVVDEGALQNVKNIFSKLNRPLIERNLKQAQVPDNCIVLPNLRGTAPGMWWKRPAYSNSPNGGEANTQPSPKEDATYKTASQKSEVSAGVTPSSGGPEGAIVVSLPGVPHEMKGLMTHSVIPKLKESLELPAVVHRTLVTSGIGESTIADTILDFENHLPGHIKLAYLPAYGVVRLRLTGRGSNVSALQKEIDEQFEKLKPLVKEWMIAQEDISLEESVSRLLKEKKKTMATAESCTGGYIAHLITSKAGSSSVYNGSVVSYANAVKENVLGVQKETLQQHGAVSEQTVTEMVKGVLKTVGADYAIATSGIMGPDGGSPEKPVGTVWIAVGNKEKIKATKHFFRFDRMRNIEMTAQTALTLLRRFIIEN